MTSEHDVREAIAKAVDNARERSGKSFAEISEALWGSAKNGQRQLLRYCKNENPVPIHWLVRYAPLVNTTVEAILADAGVIPGQGSEVDLHHCIDSSNRFTAEWKQILHASIQTAEMSSERANKPSGG